MIKPFAIAVSGVLAGSAAFAGPYANVENNAGYQDGFLGSTTDLHIGYEGGDETYGFYLQGGPALISPNGGDVEMELSGKIGGSVQATDNFGVYGEVSFITTDEEPAIGTKIGATWNF
jgi:hypothetical protein|tara:strand:- start:66 stop:419 length:354 start_codon:yes stop_codon:yes gene_type:complete